MTQRKILTTAIMAALSGPVSGQSNAVAVEFFGMPAPSTVDERADVYTAAKVKITYANGKSRILDLKYHTLTNTTAQIGDAVVGGLFDANDAPLTDSFGQLASDAPDGNSLMDIPGMRADDPATSRPLALVTNFEYRETPPDWPDVTTYTSYWSKLPATIGLTKIDQDKFSGLLDTVG